MRTFVQIIRQFRDDEDGVISVELVFVVPILVWALLSTLVYFDVYRAESISTRAGLTIADAYSREQSFIEYDFVEGSRNLLELLAEAPSAPSLRVSVFWYDEDNNRLQIAWSKVSGTYYTDILDNSDLALGAYANRIPVMANNDRAILLETLVPYEAPFSYSMGPFTGDLKDIQFETFTVIKPRFLNSTYCYDPTYDISDNGDEEC